jgi:hypothetical protein
LVDEVIGCLDEVVVELLSVPGHLVLLKVLGEGVVIVQDQVFQGASLGRVQKAFFGHL